MTCQKKKIIILGSSINSLLNFREELVKDIIKKDFKVIVSSSLSNDSSLEGVKKLGATFKPIYLKRNSLSLSDDIKTFISLFRLIKEEKPDLVLAYGIKLIIWGGLSARLNNVSFFALITGLGFAFQGKSFFRKQLVSVVSYLCKVSLKRAKAVIFQNKENLNKFVNKGIVEKSKTHIVNGSGVDLKKYSAKKIPNTDLKFLCIARLLGEKGLREYAIAAKIVKNQFPQVDFKLVGPEETSLDAISLEEVRTWSNYIDYIGQTKDVRKYIQNCHVFVLPSYHEGLPRSTLEAMSMQRPVLTTNAVGCKETVNEGLNGFKVPIGSSKKLAQKMIWFIKNKNKIECMGKQSRIIAENKFDVHKVNKVMLRILRI